MMTKRVGPPMRRQNLFTNAVKLISQCIDHLEDTDLTPNEQRARELLFDYCALLLARRDDPNYGREGKR